ncbi:MAG TPA: molybdopterin cofactor-binding domain-containing protein [Sporichthyaceae bacterium]|nr:molybdopterin cofactor-binding domain-containing protein [Sporichthyaceae bacterium]
MIPGTVPGGIGDTAVRPDGLAKALGLLAFADDLRTPGLLHAVLIRSPYPHAELLSLDVSAVVGMPGVHAVLGADDLPGAPTYGPQVADRPVLATGVVRHIGEPVAVVVAADRRTAVRAAAAVTIGYRPLPAVRDATSVRAGRFTHPDGDLIRELTVRQGEVEPPDWSAEPVAVSGATTVVEGEYSFGRRAARAGSPAAFALPVAGGVELTTTSGWWQADRDLIAQCLDLTPDQLRLVPAVASGPPDGELSVPVLAALAALRLRRPVRLVDPGLRIAPGAGPALRLRYRHHADADGRLVCLQARILADAGAYAAGSGADLARLCATAAGPYRVGSVHLSAAAVRTNNPPAFEVRGAGSAPTCVAVEAQLDRLAARLGLDPIELRDRNHLGPTDPLPTGQLVDGGSPGAALLAAVSAAPLPGRRRARVEPVGAAGLVRGVGCALGISPLLAGEGVDRAATATVRYQSGAAVISCPGAELGQGFVTVAMQIVREILGAEHLQMAAVDACAPSAGPAEGSRLTWVAGGAVHAAAKAIADELCAEAAVTQGVSASLLTARGGRICSYDGLLDIPLVDVAAGRTFERTATFCPPPTEALDPDGQGVAFAGFGFAAHRAVVEVDPELGLVRVVELVAAADVGRVVNLTQLLAVLDGGGTDGVTLALGADVGELPPGAHPVVAHLTAVDLPGGSVADLFEIPQEGSWMGVKGVWDTPVGPAAAAVLAAVRDATGAVLSRFPVRPEDLTEIGPSTRPTERQSDSETI